MKYYAPRYLFRRYEILRRVKKGVHFLEIGPGNLNLSQELLSFFQQGTLIDYNPTVQMIYNNLDMAYQQKVNLLVADFSPSLALPTEIYDCVVACEVLEHIQNDNEFLQAVHNFLKNDGQLILSVPARMKFWSQHDETVGHVRRYEKHNLTRLLEEENFHNITIISYGIPFVNFLRLPRVILAKIQYSKKAKWSQEKQSQESAFVKTGFITTLMSFAINPITTYPLSKFARLFNNSDFGNGYLVIATKLTQRSL